MQEATASDSTKSRSQARLVHAWIMFHHARMHIHACMQPWLWHRMQGHDSLARTCADQGADARALSGSLHSAAPHGVLIHACMSSCQDVHAGMTLHGHMLSGGSRHREAMMEQVKQESQDDEWEDDDAGVKQVVTKDEDHDEWEENEGPNEEEPCDDEEGADQGMEEDQDEEQQQDQQEDQQQDDPDAAAAEAETISSDSQDIESEDPPTPDDSTEEEWWREWMQSRKRRREERKEERRLQRQRRRWYKAGWVDYSAEEWSQWRRQQYWEEGQDDDSWGSWRPKEKEEEEQEQEGQKDKPTRMKSGSTNRPKEPSVYARVRSQRLADRAQACSFCSCTS